MDARGRLRLDAVARYLQDVAIDDVDETGWGSPEHLWVIRTIRIDVVLPFVGDGEADLVTWCSGQASLAAGRRTSILGDAGGKIEVDSVWIHLGPDAKPSRLEDFGVYSEAAAGRRISTRLALPDPDPGQERTPWPLRVCDVDVHGHLNNAAYWQAVEQRLPDTGIDTMYPYRAFLDYRRPIDLGDEVGLVESSAEGRFDIAFVTAGEVKAVARLEPLA
jgi:acyl-ACP thioesterase